MLRRITKWMCVVVIGLTAVNAAATANDGKMDDATKKVLIKQVQNYLNSVRSLKLIGKNMA